MPRPTAPGRSRSAPQLSDELQEWISGDHDKTLGGLMDLFGERSFGLLFVLLLGVSALPLPTGGATHVLEVIAVLLAGQLVLARRQIWIPQRWRGLTMAGTRQQRFLSVMMRLIRRLERLSRPRLAWLFDHPASDRIFGCLVIAGTVGAFVAPPFSGLDTLPSLGVVLLSLGVLLKDAAIAAGAILVGAAGVVLEFVVGRAAIHSLGSLF
jgi:hypothetical protein